MASKEKQEALAHAKEMVKVLREKLIEQAGLQSVTTDGMSVTWQTGGKSGLYEQLKYWERQVQKLQTDGSVARTIDMSGGL